MTASQIWNDLMSKATEENFEVCTMPQNKRTPLWFRICVKDGNTLVVTRAVFHRPSVALSMDRKITFKDFEYVYGYFDRWAKGEIGVRDEVRKKSQNTTYILALIAHQIGKK